MIQYLNSQAQSIKLNVLPSIEGKSDAKNSFDLQYSTTINDDDNTIFVTAIKVEVEHLGEFQISVLFVSFFKSSKPLEKDFIDSDFAGINAPAIAYPYLRSLISTITVNSGFSPAVLPTINFVQARKDLEIK